VTMEVLKLVGCC